MLSEFCIANLSYINLWICLTNLCLWSQKWTSDVCMFLEFIIVWTLATFTTNFKLKYNIRKHKAALQTIICNPPSMINAGHQYKIAAASGGSFIKFIGCTSSDSSDFPNSSWAGIARSHINQWPCIIIILCMTRSHSFTLNHQNVRIYCTLGINIVI